VSPPHYYRYSRTHFNAMCVIRVLEKLKRRVRELVEECNDARVNYKNMQRERGRLKKQKEVEMDKITEWRDKAQGEQLHKFGREVDLDTLQVDGDHTEDVNELAAREERERVQRVLDKLQNDSDVLKDRLADVTKVNTSLLKKISVLLEEKNKIVSDLRAPGGDVLQDNSVLTQEKAQEGQALVNVVSHQAWEIEEMKAEILNLKRKETPHLVPMLPLPTGGNPTTPGLFPPIAKQLRGGASRNSV
jgi:hypothetical protein